MKHDGYEVQTTKVKGSYDVRSRNIMASNNAASWGQLWTTGAAARQTKTYDNLSLDARGSVLKQPDLHARLPLQKSENNINWLLKNALRPRRHP